MRVSNSGLTDNIKRSLASHAERMGDLYGQLSSGKRLQKLSDDPTAVERALRAHTCLNELDARRHVAGQGQRLVGATDSALGDIASTLSQARDLALRAANGSLGAAERGALAAQVRTLREVMGQVGNTEVQGHYVFAGSQTSTPPFRNDGAANLPVAYDGNHQRLAYQAGPDERIWVGFVGAEVFNYPDATGTRPVAAVDADAFSVLTELAEAMEAGDTARLAAGTEQLTALHAHTVNLRGQNGVLARRWERVVTNAEDAALVLNEVLADEESADLSALIVELSSLETTYQAALSLTARLFEMPNLFELQ